MVKPKQFILQRNQRKNLEEYKQAVDKYCEIVNGFYNHFMGVNMQCQYAYLIEISKLHKVYKRYLLKLLKNDKYKVKQIILNDINYEKYEISIG